MPSARIVTVSSPGSSRARSSDLATEFSSTAVGNWWIAVAAWTLLGWQLRSATKIRRVERKACRRAPVPLDLRSRARCPGKTPDTAPHDVASARWTDVRFGIVFHRTRRLQCLRPVPCTHRSTATRSWLWPAPDIALNCHSFTSKANRRPTGQVRPGTCRPLRPWPERGGHQGCGPRAGWRAGRCAATVSGGARQRHGLRSGRRE